MEAENADYVYTHIFGKEDGTVFRDRIEATFVLEEANAALAVYDADQNENKDQSVLVRWQNGERKMWIHFGVRSRRKERQFVEFWDSCL